MMDLYLWHKNHTELNFAAIKSKWYTTTADKSIGLLAEVINWFIIGIVHTINDIMLRQNQSFITMDNLLVSTPEQT